MHKESKKVFNNQILYKAVKLFDLEKDSVKSLGGFESFIFAAKCKYKDVILRISHSLHRTKNEIKAEIEWVNFLFEKGLPVPRAYRSINHNTVEVIKAGDSYFLATVTTKLKGDHIKRDEKTDKIFYNLGKILGKMHRETKDFRFSNPAFTRPCWDKEFNELVEFLPEEQMKVQQRIDEPLDEIYKLPRDKDSFGLIHTDAHFGNMFVDKGNLNIFDFDDSAYKWFVSDIAIVVFYEVLLKYDTLNKQDIAALIMTNLMKGYREENHLANIWLDKMPLFLKLRELTLYLVIYRSFDINNLKDPWCVSYMKNRKEKIEKGVPFLPHDFTKYKL